MFGDWDMEWEAYTTRLTMAFIRIYDHNDIIVWCLNKKHGDVTTSLAYNALVEKHSPKYLPWWMSWVWNGKIPTKIQLFHLVGS